MCRRWQRLRWWTAAGEPRHERDDLRQTSQTKTRARGALADPFLDATGGGLPLLCTLNCVVEEVRLGYGLSRSRSRPWRRRTRRWAAGLSFLPYLGEKGANWPGRAAPSWVCAHRRAGTAHRAALEGRGLSLRAASRAEGVAASFERNWRRRRWWWWWWWWGRFGSSGGRRAPLAADHRRRAAVHRDDALTARERRPRRRASGCSGRGATIRGRARAAKDRDRGVDSGEPRPTRRRGSDPAESRRRGGLRRGVSSVYRARGLPF